MPTQPRTQTFSFRRVLSTKPFGGFPNELLLSTQLLLLDQYGAAMGVCEVCVCIRYNTHKWLGILLGPC